MAAAAAEEASPALAAFRFSHNMSMTEFLYQFRFYYSSFQSTQLVLLTTYKLMAGINIAVCSNSKIFMASTTACFATNFT